jgi:hypothetical protein
MYALVMYTYPVVHIQQEAPPTLADKIWYNTLSSFMMWMECLQNSAGNRLIMGAVPMKLEFYLANELDTYTICNTQGGGVGLPFKEEIHIRMQVVTPPPTIGIGNHKKVIRTWKSFVGTFQT